MRAEFFSNRNTIFNCKALLLVLLQILNARSKTTGTDTLHFITVRTAAYRCETYDIKGDFIPQKQNSIVKLRQGSGKDRQGMALKAKGLKAYIKVGCHPPPPMSGGWMSQLGVR